MKRWPLKLKVSVLCMLLTLFALLGTAGIILAIVYKKQVADLDDSLSENTKQLFDELEIKHGPAALFRKGISFKIPTSLSRRYIVLEKGGEELFRTRFTAFKDVDLSSRPPGPQTIRVGDKDSRFVHEQHGPITIWMGTRLGVIEASQQAIMDAYLYYAIPGVTLLVFFGAMGLAGHALRPVSAITAAAERISAQSPEERLPRPDTNDEIARLTDVLNQSFDRLQRAYTSAARFSADASHQLKTPIAVLRAGLEELRMCEELGDQDRETIEILLQQTRRLTTLVEDLLLLAQADAGRLKIDPTVLDLKPVLEAVVDDTDALGAEKDLTVAVDLPSELYAKADIRRVKIILQNLTENAVKYNREHGRIRINGRREGSWSVITVANTGPAIPEEYRDRLFERFNRAGMGENIKGHGLGLNIARELARAHGGDLYLVHSDGQWTEFAVRLPGAEPAAVAALPVGRTT